MHPDRLTQTRPPREENEDSRSSPSKFPLRIGQPNEFALVRQFFKASEFDDASLCRVLKMDDMSDLGRVAWDSVTLQGCPKPQHWCIQVFLRGFSSSQSECKSICGDALFSAFVSLGLLRPRRRPGSADPKAGDSGQVVCPVWVYPADGFILLSDRRDDPDGGPYTPGEDVVFPAIYAGTLRFLKLLPEMRGADALDLCGGSGIGALHLSRTAATATTADLTERSAFFAEFNGRLNGVSIASFCGDLYTPVERRQFDVFSAHPPFVPATGPNMVYRDAGETGEEVTRRIIEGLPHHLRSGGTCVILCVARDTTEKPFEQRARDWLGATAQEFDIVFGLEKVLSLENVLDSLRKRHEQLPEEQVRQLADRLRSLDTRQFVYGALFIRRYEQPLAQNPCRIQLSSGGSARDFERLLGWRAQTRQAGFADWLTESRPKFAAGLDLTVRHLVNEGQLVPVEFVFSIDNGFRAALRPDGWVVPLVARLDGTRSVREVFQAAEKEDELPQGFTMAAFVDLIRGMIERGFLDLSV